MPLQDVPYDVPTSVAELLGLPNTVGTQDPAIQTTRGKRPRYFIRPYVERLVEGRIERTQECIYLDAESKRDAIPEKNRIMGTINQSKYVLQSQMSFGVLHVIEIQIDSQKPSLIPTCSKR